MVVFSINKSKRYFRKFVKKVKKMEQKLLIDVFNSDIKSLNTRIHDTCLLYFEYSLNIATLINDCITVNNPMEGHYKLKLVYIGRTFRKFCELFIPLRKFTKMQVVNKENLLFLKKLTKSVWTTKKRQYSFSERTTVTQLSR